jgi:hypothetical protein
MSNTAPKECPSDVRMDFNLIHSRDDFGNVEDPLRFEDIEIG